MPFVQEFGWSKDAISAGAKATGYPSITHGMFSRGGADLVHYFQNTSNLKLIEILKKVIMHYACSHRFDMQLLYFCSIKKSNK